MNQDTLLDLMMKSVDADTNRMCADAGQMTLGELAATLRQFDQSLIVEFSDGTNPGDLDSYRGYYRFISIEHGNDPMTVGSLLSRVESSIGATFTGYKGGEYTMSRMTPVWVSDYGMASGDGVIGVAEQDGKAILHIAQIED